MTSTAQTNTPIHITSFNVNGLGQDTKRQAIFNKLKKDNVILLQETHSRALSGKNGKMNRDHKQLRCCHPLSPNLDYHIFEKYYYNNERILLLKCKFEESVYVIVNCYALTQQYKKNQRDFINIVKSHINKLDNENIIMGGNFKFYLDPDLNMQITMTSKDNNSVFRNAFNALLDSINLVDAWRVQKPQY